jgi:hypothetical protein
MLFSCLYDQPAIHDFFFFLLRIACYDIELESFFFFNPFSLDLQNSTVLEHDCKLHSISPTCLAGNAACCVAEAHVRALFGGGMATR